MASNTRGECCFLALRVSSRSFLLVSFTRCLDGEVGEGSCHLFIGWLNALP